MKFTLDEEQQILKESVRELCAQSVAPNVRRWDEEERFPEEVIAPMAQMGLFGIQIPEAYGGAGMRAMDYVVALEEVARADGSVGLTMACHNSLCAGHILIAGSEEQKQRYLPRLASGQALGAWALTEPSAGSDAGAVRTRAVRKGDGWAVTGTKTLVTQGSVAGIYVVLASTAPEKKRKGLTAFVIEAGTPGLRSRKIEKLGVRASDTAEVALEEVEVPDAQRLGAVDRGFFDALRAVDKGRTGLAAWAVGIGRAALETALSYARQRVQFGKPIAEFQAIQFMLADMATELDAARLLVWRAAWMEDRGMTTVRESPEAKYFAARAATRACNAAVQVHGGYGYTREFPVERYLRNAKLAEIGGGTNEIQKIVIAREILRRV